MKTFLSRILAPAVLVAVVAIAPARADAAILNTAIHGGPSGTTAKRTASFHVQGYGGAARIQCKLNSGSWYVCARSSSKVVVLRNLARRTHTFSARAVSRSGKVDRTPAKRTWRVR